MLNLKYQVILGSKSPRRVELLAGLDIEFNSRVMEVDEVYPDTLSPKDVPEFLAKKKATAQKAILKSNELLITADTIVIVDGIILEKPKSKPEAIEMLTTLSDKSHTVVTGVSLMASDKWISFSDTTEGNFGPMSVDEIEYYINKYQPFDKAGSYGVQEWIGYIGIKKMTGSYYNVMGLPVHKLYQALKKF